MPAAQTAPGFPGREEPPSALLPPPTHTSALHCLNPAAPRVSIASPLLGPGRQPSLPVGTLRVKRKTHKLIPQHSFRQTLVLFTHIHLPRRRRKKGGEKSLLNPTANTLLIHTFVFGIDRRAWHTMGAIIWAPGLQGWRGHVSERATASSFCGSNSGERKPFRPPHRGGKMRALMKTQMQTKWIYLKANYGARKTCPQKSTVISSTCVNGTDFSRLAAAFCVSH